MIEATRYLVLEEFLRLDRVLLMDLEFTCWEDSLRTSWADPRRPPEVLEIGLAAYSFAREELVDSFSAVVRPRINPALSPYCRELLALTQAEVDAAPPLGQVLVDVRTWEARLGPGTPPTCGWGTIDRRFLTQDAERAGAADPFAGRPHADLRRFFAALFHHPTPAIERDEVRRRGGLPDNRGRHRALPDTLDLIPFCAFLARQTRPSS